MGIKCSLLFFFSRCFPFLRFCEALTFLRSLGGEMLRNKYFSLPVMALASIGFILISDSLRQCCLFEAQQIFPQNCVLFPHGVLPQFRVWNLEIYYLGNFQSVISWKVGAIVQCSWIYYYYCCCLSSFLCLVFKITYLKKIFVGCVLLQLFCT